MTGWAFGPGTLRIEAWINGKCVAQARPGIPRIDVANAFPKAAGALHSGFLLDLSRSVPADGVAEVRIVAQPLLTLRPRATIATLTMTADNVLASLQGAAPVSHAGPFPKAVVEAVSACWPEDASDLATAEGQRRFVARLKKMMAAEGVKSIPALTAYFRYLSATIAHCRFVERCFPSENTRATDGADFHCKPNSINELFAIIHHLYVLKSWGVEGDFAEFGCFKGYSSSMLSFACAQLGIKMHIFDSFEGLPPAPGSAYAAGQYAGGLEEVTENVTRFGARGSVEFHKGFFADSLKEKVIERLMTLWMDVDLELSAQDLLVVADAVDPRAAVFSHECPPDIFREDKIVTGPHPDNPIWPLLQRFEALERPLTGHHVAGYTGAFWPRHGGIPVAKPGTLAMLLEIVDSR